MDPVGKLIKILLALALTGLVLYFFRPRQAHGFVQSTYAMEHKT